MRFEVERDIAAPRRLVWRVLTDWERQPDWMPDAKAVHVVTPHREGAGVTVRCPTNILGVTVQDILRVTRWDDARLLEVVHLGRIIRGTAAFELSDRDGDTHVAWWEQVTPPLGRVGRLGAELAARPVVEHTFRRSLANLASICERHAAGHPARGVDRVS